MFKWLLILFPALCLTLQAKAQGEHYGLGSWNIITVNFPGSTQHKVGGFFEAQNRNYGILSHFYYHEEKLGISYNVDDNSFFLLGTGRYTTYNFDAVSEGPGATENRLWEQFTYNHFIGRVKLEHRYRIEQRWVNQVYRNRFRYRLNMFIPLNKPALNTGAVFIAAFGEVFMNNREPNLERNRFQPTLGYKFSKAFMLQGGFINQRNYGPASSNDKNYLIVNATYNIQRN